MVNICNHCIKNRALEGHPFIKKKGNKKRRNYKYQIVHTVLHTQTNLQRKDGGNYFKESDVILYNNMIDTILEY